MYHTVLWLSVYTSVSLESGFFESRDHLKFIIEDQVREHRVYFYKILLEMKCLSKKHFGARPKEVVCNLKTLYLCPQKPSAAATAFPFDNSSTFLPIQSSELWSWWFPLPRIHFPGSLWHWYLLSRSSCSLNIPSPVLINLTRLPCYSLSRHTVSFLPALILTWNHSQDGVFSFSVFPSRMLVAPRGKVP